MSTPYTVQPGDYLGKIARDQGYSTWQEIYYAPDNADFRQLRPNPNLIYPGDVPDAAGR
jgi:N-acetylmuramoyl-L-alanine amidase